MWLVKALTIASLYLNICNCQDAFNTSNILNVSNNLRNFTDTYLTNNGNRIIGGMQTDIGRSPYLAAVFKDNFFYCGGSIISRIFVLTAGHCIVKGSKYKIRAGSSFYSKGGIVRHVVRIALHSGFKLSNLKNDIALLKLRKPLFWSSNIRPIRMAQPGSRVPNQMRISGWGTTNVKKRNPSQRLRSATVSKTLPRKCQNEYKNIIRINGKSQVCASSPGKDSCEGDSGGPLYLNSVQYGIVSFGLGCARKNFSGVYTSIAFHYKWIRNSQQLLA